MSTADYDHVKGIAIGPWGINDTAKTLHDLSQNVADSVGRIGTTLQSLVLNDWMGKTQQEADDFNTRWAAVMGEVFGGHDKPNDGVLNALASGIGIAGNNYDKAEFGLVDVWNRFSGKFGDGKSDDPPSKNAPPDELDTNKTAITADYPSHKS
ncbi:hypothetical protein [Actinoallomurus sp. CA-142502]|uniref:hypothetical protein n=1 Tax=Actinoallomurus sp. CA-142502 TaxID=3239885 RepID=UPI003D91B96F